MGATYGIRLRSLSRVDAVGTSSAKQLMLDDEVAHLWQVKHQMYPIWFVMS